MGDLEEHFTCHQVCEIDRYPRKRANMVKKTCSWEVYLLISHFYNYSKTWVPMSIPIFSYFDPKHRLWVVIRRGGSNEYPQSMF